VNVGLFDKLTGTREGDPGVAPVSAGDLRAALLAAGEGKSWQVRDGAEHGCDLVAEWQVAVERHGKLSERHLEAAFRVKMKFNEAEHEVRHNSQGTSTSSGTGFRSGGRPATTASPGSGAASPAGSATASTPAT
jgi:hypothetical protein